MHDLQNKLVQGKTRGTVGGQQRHYAVGNDLGNMCVCPRIPTAKGSHGTHKSAVLSLVPCLTLFMLTIFSSFFFFFTLLVQKREKIQFLSCS